MLPELHDLPEDHRSGFIAVIGRPNVGKSTLLNRLLGQKIAITSPKPQTTRDQIMGILTGDAFQAIFLDTPGIHKPTNKLGEHMMDVVSLSVNDADLVLWLVDIHVPPKPEDRAIADLLRKLSQRGPLPPVIIGLNKLDQPRAAADLATRQAEYAALLEWVPSSDTHADGSVSVPPVQTIAFSARNGNNVDTLEVLLHQSLPVGPRYFPEDQVTDLQIRFIVAELIREKALLRLQQEVPHSLAVVVDEFTARRDNLTYIAAVLYVERTSHKGIVLGRNGSKIKQIGQDARPEIEELVGTKVYLELWVKVWEKWRRKEAMLKRLGYATE